MNLWESAAGLPVQRLEGIGIDPDVVIDWPLIEATVEDPQLQRALAVLEAQL